jgi:HIRAN domain-containing protein
MSVSIIHRIPVVAGLAYPEAASRLPSSCTATLVTEPENRYFRHAIAVLVGGEKVGYVAPEIARRYFEPLKSHADPVTCPASRGSQADHRTSGVELLLDFSALAVAPAE